MRIKSIDISGILSFSQARLELQNLNVLIGPNGAGKSNLIEVLYLLHMLPSDYSAALRRSGAAADWLWYGSKNGVGKIEIIIDETQRRRALGEYKYQVVFEGKNFRISGEKLIDNKHHSSNGKPKLFVDISDGEGEILARKKSREGQVPRHKIKITKEEISKGQSILHEIKDPIRYPEIRALERFLDSICFFRNWQFGYQSPPRVPQPTDIPSDFLEEDAGNLAMVLNNLDREGHLEKIVKELNEFYENADRLKFKVEGGTIQLFLQEKGFDKAIPATRLSDGTIRHLCLLSILLHPSPPPLVCIEEPELGFHPDILPQIARLLKEASERMQLIVTTHSDILVDELSDTPDSVIVCERSLEEGGTEFNRLKTEELNLWLKDYSLGRLWRKGVTGGNRW